MNKARCFVSYCATDVDASYVTEIVNKLKAISEASNYFIEFLFDKNLKVGESLNQFMEEINTVDSVIMICSPEYKKRSQNESYQTSGVYKECKLMLERLKRIEELRQNEESIDDVNFKIFPLVIQLDKNGKSNDSVPEFVSHLMREKIDKIKFVIEKNKIKLDMKSMKEYKRLFTDCIVATSVIHGQKSEYLEMNIQKLLKNLIYDRKAENAPVLDTKKFVNTFFYEQLKTQSAYILIGRKGSGKTTAKKYFFKQNRTGYKDKIELNINTIGLDGIYNYIFHGPYDANMPLRNMTSDLKEIFTYEKLIEYVWLVYIYSYSMYIVACEYKYHKDKLSANQVKNFKFIYDKFNDVLLQLDEKYERWTNGNNISRQLYMYALSGAYRFLNFTIDNARDNEEYFLSDIVSQLNEKKLLEFVFSKELILYFHEGINQCTKKILFTVDGFDADAELFRKQALSSNPAEAQQKAQFEIKWIFILLETILKIKLNNQNPLYKNMDMCVSIPKDKFIEVLALNRDKCKYTDKICGIEWSGVELLIMIRKRLETLCGYPYSKSDKKNLPYYEILNNILDKFYPEIPKEINVKTASGRIYKIHLFFYMLRYSFWRPRDLLVSLSNILKLYYGSRKSKAPINEETIKEAIKNASITIVNSDFINEYNSMWKEIETGIKEFRGKNILLSVKEVENIVMSKKFNLYLEVIDEKILDFRKIISFLFEIGFLGIFVTSQYQKKYQMITKQGFVFYEGMNCLNGFINDDFTNCMFCINPVFVEYLNLVIDTDELIGTSNWDTLDKLENSMRLNMMTDFFV